MHDSSTRSSSARSSGWNGATPPDDLDELVPHYLRALPQSAVTLGGAFTYQRKDVDYVLWAAGTRGEVPSRIDIHPYTPLP